MNQQKLKETLKMAVPVASNIGLDSPISSHFGRAPGFMTLQSDGTDLVFHDSCLSRKASECAPVSMFVAEDVEFVVAKSMGKGALNRCHQAGLLIFQTGASSIAELLEAMQGGPLMDFPDDALCSHSHEGGSHSH